MNDSNKTTAPDFSKVPEFHKAMTSLAKVKKSNVDAAVKKERDAHGKKKKSK
jgi:hypothetical protein